MDIIFSYSRKEALEDKVLIDVTNQAYDVGFKIPVALTAALHGTISTIPKSCNYQSYQGRLWDVLFMAMLSSKGSEKREIKFKVKLPHEIINNEGKIELREYLTIKSVIGPGDFFEPVITMMLPYED